VRGGDGDASVEAELGDRVIEHLGSDEPELYDLDAAVCEAVHDRRADRRRRYAHVPPDRDGTRLELLRVPPCDAVRAFLVQLRRIDPANVVGLEDGRIEHPGMLVAFACVSTLHAWSASSHRFCSSTLSTRRASSGVPTPRSYGVVSRSSSRR